MAAFEELEEKWGKPYPAIPRMWRAVWEEFIPVLAYDVEIRRVLRWKPAPNAFAVTFADRMPAPENL